MSDVATDSDVERTSLFRRSVLKSSRFDRFSNQ